MTVEMMALWSVAAAVLVIAALPAWWWGPRAVASVLAGGLWNLASLWCLAKLLEAWLRPSGSRRPSSKALMWLAAKLALIGLLIGVVFRAPWLSFVGFGIGVTVVLIVIVAGLGFRAQAAAHPSHGR